MTMTIKLFNQFSLFIFYFSSLFANVVVVVVVVVVVAVKQYFPQ